MSYDVNIKINNKTVILPEKHEITGGTYQVGGTNEAWINITYNYSKWFHDLWTDGLYEIEGKTVDTVIPMLKSAVMKLGTKQEKDYWKSTAGNAGHSLNRLLKICKLTQNAGFGYGKITIT